MVMLSELLQQKRPVVIKRWVQFVLDAYKSEAAVLLSKKKDKFANPAGDRLEQGIGCMFDALQSGAEVKCGDESLALLDDLIRVRAVQDAPPSQALDFVFAIKGIVRDEFKDEAKKADMQKELLGFERRVDQLALAAFDYFIGCREKIYALRVKQIQRQHHLIVKRFNQMEAQTGEDKESEVEASVTPLEKGIGK